MKRVILSAGAMLIFSVSFQIDQMSRRTKILSIHSFYYPPFPQTLPFPSQALRHKTFVATVDASFYFYFYFLFLWSGSAEKSNQPRPTSLDGPGGKVPPPPPPILKSHFRSNKLKPAMSEAYERERFFFRHTPSLLDLFLPLQKDANRCL